MRQETAHIYLDHPTPFRYSFYGTKKEKEQLFLQFVLSLIDGRRYSVYGKNAKEISQKEQEIRKKIEAGIYTDSRNITLDKYFDEWLEAKRGSIKGNTVKWYATYYKGHISPCLGNVKLQKMERRQVLAFQRNYQREIYLYGRATIL